MPAKCRSDVGTSPDPNMRHVTDPMSFNKEHYKLPPIHKRYITQNLLITYFVYDIILLINKFSHRIWSIAIHSI